MVLFANDAQLRAVLQRFLGRILCNKLLALCWETRLRETVLLPGRSLLLFSTC